MVVGRWRLHAMKHSTHHADVTLCVLPAKTEQSSTISQLSVPIIVLNSFRFLNTEIQFSLHHPSHLDFACGLRSKGLYLISALLCIPFGSHFLPFVCLLSWRHVPYINSALLALLSFHSFSCFFSWTCQAPRLLDFASSPCSPGVTVSCSLACKYHQLITLFARISQIPASCLTTVTFHLSLQLAFATFLPPPSALLDLDCPLTLIKLAKICCSHIFTFLAFSNDYLEQWHYG